MLFGYLRTMKIVSCVEGFYGRICEVWEVNYVLIMELIIILVIELDRLFYFDPMKGEKLYKMKIKISITYVNAFVNICHVILYDFLMSLAYWYFIYLTSVIIYTMCGCKLIIYKFWHFYNFDMFFNFKIKYVTNNMFTKEIAEIIINIKIYLNNFIFIIINVYNHIFFLLIWSINLSLIIYKIR